MTMEQSADADSAAKDWKFKDSAMRRRNDWLLLQMWKDEQDCTNLGSKLDTTREWIVQSRTIWVWFSLVRGKPNNATSSIYPTLYN